MNQGKYVVFRLGNGQFGFPIAQVERILPSQGTTRVPRSNKLVLGIFDLRGETIPVLDTYGRLKLNKKSDAKNFIVVQSNAGRCALPVDAVSGILNFDEKDIENDVANWVEPEDPIAEGVGKINGQLVLLLNADQLVPHNVFKGLKKAA